MQKKVWLITGFCLLIGLSACNQKATEDPTPPATMEAPFIETATPSPTVDLSTAITNGDWSDLLQVADLGPRREVEHGGFALDIPDGFIPSYRPGTIILRQEDGDLTLSAGGGLELGPIPLEIGLENFMLAMAQDVTDLTQSEYETIQLAGQEGLAVDFQGMLGNQRFVGRILYLVTTDLHFLVVMGSSLGQDWESTGIEAYVAFIDSIELFTPTPMERLCPVSADPTFGYTQENPIRVGQGDPLTGPSMQRDYLNLLFGPNGESVTYVRRGSFSSEDSILDEYQVTFGDPPTTAILYLDQYHDGQFRLPQGFICGN